MVYRTGKLRPTGKLGLEYTALGHPHESAQSRLSVSEALMNCPPATRTATGVKKSSALLSSKHRCTATSFLLGGKVPESLACTEQRAARAAVVRCAKPKITNTL